MAYILIVPTFFHLRQSKDEVPIVLILSMDEPSPDNDQAARFFFAYSSFQPSSAFVNGIKYLRVFCAPEERQRERERERQSKCE